MDVNNYNYNILVNSHYQFIYTIVGKYSIPCSSCEKDVPSSGAKNTKVWHLYRRLALGSWCTGHRPFQGCFNCAVFKILCGSCFNFQCVFWDLYGFIWINAVMT